MRTSIRITLMIFFYVLFTGAAFAQTTNFSGNWNVDTTKIDFGQAPHWILPVSIKVSQDGAKVSITRNSVDQQGTQSGYTENLSPGDTAATTVPGNAIRKAVLAWSADKSSFTVNSQSTHADGSPGTKITEVWSLVDGGKTLEIDRNVEQANGLKYSIKTFYNKQ